MPLTFYITLPSATRRHVWKNVLKFLAALKAERKANNPLLSSNTPTRATENSPEMNQKLCKYYAPCMWNEPSKKKTNK